MALLMATTPRFSVDRQEKEAPHSANPRPRMQRQDMSQNTQDYPNTTASL